MPGSRQTEDMATDLHVPHPPRRLPILGDVFSVDRNAPTQSELALAQQLGPIYELKFGPAKFFVVSSGKLATEVNNEERWSKLVAGPFRAMRTKGFTGRGLLTANSSDPMWSHANSLLGPAFTQDAMRSYHHQMVHAVDDLLALWAAAGAPVDVVNDMSRLTLEIIGRAGFGRSLGTLNPDYDYGFTDKLRDALKAVSESANDFPGSDTINRKRTRKYEADKRWLRRYAEGLIDQPDEDVQASLLGNMLRGAADTPALPRENIVDQAITFLAAGTDTTAGLLSFATYFLARDEQLLRSAQADVVELVGQRPIAFEDVPRLRSIRRILDETLRLWPVAPGYFRIAQVDQRLGDHEIRRGEVVFVLTLGVHRDTETWGPDAAEFDPDRFLPGRSPKHPDRVFKPFGTGPRACIGRQFALHEATLALASIIRSFDIRFPDGIPPLEIDEMLTLKPHYFGLSLYDRT